MGFSNVPGPVPNKPITLEHSGRTSGYAHMECRQRGKCGGDAKLASGFEAEMLPAWLTLRAGAVAKVASISVA